MACPLYRDCPLLRDSNCIILIGGLKFGDLVLSIVERDLIQCPLFGVSIKRESTVAEKLQMSPFCSRGYRLNSSRGLISGTCKRVLLNKTVSTRHYHSGQARKCDS